MVSRCPGPQQRSPQPSRRRPPTGWTDGRGRSATLFAVGHEGDVRVRVLGPVSVDGVAATELGNRKARSMLAMLATARGAPVTVDVIVDTLWGDAPPAKPAEQVSVLASRLRRALGTDRVARSDAGYALVADWLDVAELDARVSEARARLSAGSAGTARAAAAGALDLVRGPLAAEEDAPWFDGPRTAVDRTIAEARSLLAEGALLAGDAVAAAGAAWAALDHDPYDEHALRLLMRAYVAAGRPASALDAYARVRARLGEDLGVDPSRETEDLHTAILLPDVAGRLVTSRRPPAVVGRAGELALLDTHLARAAAGDSVAVVVEGEPGIGKTALVRGWADSLAPADAVVLAGQCDPMGRGLTLQPVLDALDAHLHRADPARAAAILGEDAAVLGPLLAARGPVRPAGEAPAGVPIAGVPPAAAPDSGGPTRVTDVDAAQGVLHAALLAAVERARDGEGALVLVVDDVHLAAPGTIAWLSFALRRGAHLLVVATCRSAAVLPALPGVTRVELGPLDVAAIAELVGDAQARATEIHTRSGGNPLFAVALATHQGATVPRSVRDAVVARAGEVGDDAAATLRAAAVLDPRVDLDLLAVARGRPITDLLDHVERGIEARLLAERDGAVVFEHELVRDALAAATPAATRSYLHRAAASALAGRSHRDPLAVAHHARLGNDAPLAARALLDAAATASTRCDLDEAGRLLDEALALDDTAAVRLAHARVDLARLRLDDAARHADAAHALDGSVVALELAGWVAYYQRDYDAAHRFADEGLRRAGEGALRASCLALAGRVRHSRGDLSAASPLLEEAVASASREVLPVARTWLAGLRVHQGRAADGLDLAARATLDRAVAAHPFAPLHALFAHAYALGVLGRPADALDALDRLDRAVAEAGAPGERFAGVAANGRSWTLRNLGSLDQADELSGIAVDLAGDVTVHAEPRFAGRLDLVETHLARRDLEAAGAAIEALSDLDEWQGTMAWHQRHRLGLQRARLALATGDAGVASELAEAVRDDAAARGAPRYETLAALVLARARAAAGAPVDVAALDALVDTLPRVAGMEAWWLAADMAAEFGSDRWRVASERLADVLARRAGRHGESLRAFARSRWAVATRPRG